MSSRRRKRCSNGLRSPSPSRPVRSYSRDGGRTGRWLPPRATNGAARRPYAAGATLSVRLSPGCSCVAISAPATFGPATGAAVEAALHRLTLKLQRERLGSRGPRWSRRCPIGLDRAKNDLTHAPGRVRATSAVQRKSVRVSASYRVKAMLTRQPLRCGR